MVNLIHGNECIHRLNIGKDSMYVSTRGRNTHHWACAISRSLSFQVGALLEWQGIRTTEDIQRHLVLDKVIYAP